MDGFQHEAGLLREVAGGLEERLAGAADWAVFRRTGIPPERLVADTRFQAWQACQDALSALSRNRDQQHGSSGEQDLPIQSGDFAGKSAVAKQISMTAAPHRAFSHQVAAVEVIRRLPSEGPRVPLDEQAAGLADRATSPSTAVPVPPAISDDLTLVRGINRETARQLNALGVYRIAQIAGWTAHDVARIRDGLGCGTRIARENWIERAAVIARRELSAEKVPSPEVGLEVPATDVVSPEPENERPYARPDDCEDAASASASRLRRVRRLPLPRYEKPTASVGVVYVDGQARGAAPKSNSAVSEAPVAVANGSGTVGRARASAILDPLLIKGVTKDDVRALSGFAPLDTAVIAGWTRQDMLNAEAALGEPGRISREGWIDQASLLSRGTPTAWTRLAAIIASQSLVQSPAPQLWVPRALTSASPARSDATVAAAGLEPGNDAAPHSDDATLDSEASLDQRIARLQAEVERIRNLPDFSKNDRPQEAASVHLPPPLPRLADRLELVRLDASEPPQSEQPTETVRYELPSSHNDATSIDDWELDALDVEEAAVKIVSVDSTPDAGRRPEVPFSPSRTLGQADNGARGRPLEERLQASMTSVVRRRRIERDEASRLPPPNYADTPEEASVQIIYRDTHHDPHRDPGPDGVNSPPDASSDPAPAQSARDLRPGRGTGEKKPGLKRYLKALTGER